jgi:hypothetical protein
MKTKALVLFSFATLLAMPVQAEVFSSQTFDGSEATLNALPGVNLDAVPGMNGLGGNCSEDTVPAFSGGLTGDAKATTCKYGNFSITTTGSQGPRNHLDTTYGGNPPPWQQGWRP